MGPTALFDKSFLQSLSVDEAVVFDHFFIAVICPTFYVETLADLEKAARPGRTPDGSAGAIRLPLCQSLCPLQELSSQRSECL